MTVKLNLTIDEDVVKRTKRYAKKTNTSISKMVQEYLDKTTQNEKVPLSGARNTGSFSSSRYVYQSIEGRKPEDGRINWQQSAQQVYNLHRAVAPPYPGAFTDIAGNTYVISKARLSSLNAANLPQGLCVVDNVIFGVCGDGRAIHIIELLSNGELVSASSLQQQLSAQ